MDDEHVCDDHHISVLFTAKVGRSADSLPLQDAMVQSSANAGCGPTHHSLISQIDHRHRHFQPSRVELVISGFDRHQVDVVVSRI